MAGRKKDLSRISKAIGIGLRTRKRFEKDRERASIQFDAHRSKTKTRFEH